MAILGPTLLDLQYISESTTEQIALMITGRSIGVLLGCILSSKYHHKRRIISKEMKILNLLKGPDTCA